jgi:ABC-type transport system substrate-binding protein
MKPTTPGYVMIGLLGGIAALAMISVVQLNSLEKRISTQSKQIRVLGEANERIAGQMKRIQGGGAGQAAADDGCDIDKVLHPEVEDFLGTKDTRWPPEGATTNGVYKYGWYFGDPKGFNPLVENAADLQDYILHYVASPIAERTRWTNPNTWFGVAACRVEITDDYKEYTIYLRKGIKWHKPGGVDLSNPRYKWLDKEHELTAED